eukprot:403371718
MINTFASMFGGFKQPATIANKNQMSNTKRTLLDSTKRRLLSEEKLLQEYMDIESVFKNTMLFSKNQYRPQTMQTQLQQSNQTQGMQGKRQANYNSIQGSNGKNIGIGSHINEVKDSGRSLLGSKILERNVSTPSINLNEFFSNRPDKRYIFSPVIALQEQIDQHFLPPKQTSKKVLTRNLAQISKKLTKELSRTDSIISRTLSLKKATQLNINKNTGDSQSSSMQEISPIERAESTHIPLNLIDDEIQENQEQQLAVTFNLEAFHQKHILQKTQNQQTALVDLKSLQKIKQQLKSRQKLKQLQKDRLTTILQKRMQQQLQEEINELDVTKSFDESFEKGLEKHLNENLKAGKNVQEQRPSKRLKRQFKRDTIQKFFANNYNLYKHEITAKKISDEFMIQQKSTSNKKQ